MFDLIKTICQASILQLKHTKKYRHQGLITLHSLWLKAWLAFEVEYVPEVEVNKAKPKRFEGHNLGKKQ